MAKEIKKIRMIDVAREAGVSLTTVGQVLLKSGGKNVRVSQKTANHILEVANRLNYTPNHIAQQLAGKKSNIIGVFIDPTASRQATDRLAEMESLIHKKGYRLMIGHPMNDPEQTSKYVDDFRARGIEGLICIHHAYPGNEKFVPNEVQKLPNVVFIKKPAIDNAYYVDIDEVDGTKQAVEHLKKRGAKRIAIALSDNQWPGNKQRLQGYFDTIAGQEKIVWIASEYIPTTRDANYILPSDAELIVENVIVNKKADAIIAMNDYWAARIISCLHKKGYKVPEQIKIVGYDNLDIGTYIEPNITTIDPKQHQAAKLAVEMLFKLINGNITEKEKVTIIKPHLLIRQSS